MAYVPPTIKEFERELKYKEKIIKEENYISEIGREYEIKYMRNSVDDMLNFCGLLALWNLLLTIFLIWSLLE